MLQVPATPQPVSKSGRITRRGIDRIAYMPLDFVVIFRPICPLARLPPAFRHKGKGNQKGNQANGNGKRAEDFSHG